MYSTFLWAKEYDDFNRRKPGSSCNTAEIISFFQILINTIFRIWWKKFEIIINSCMMSALERFAYFVLSLRLPCFCYLCYFFTYPPYIYWERNLNAFYATTDAHTNYASSQQNSLWKYGIMHVYVQKRLQNERKGGKTNILKSNMKSNNIHVDVDMKKKFKPNCKRCYVCAVLQNFQKPNICQGRQTKTDLSCNYQKFDIV